LIHFKQHAVQTNEIFLLVAELFARFCSYLDQNGGDIQQTVTNVLSPLETFQRHLWWDVAVAPPHKQESLRQTLQTLVMDSWHLLNRVLHLEERGIAGILSSEYLARWATNFLCESELFLELLGCLSKIMLGSTCLTQL
jgi:hypothetical protein